MEHCKACQLCIANPVCDEAISLYSNQCMKVMETFDKLGFNGAREHISQQTKECHKEKIHKNKKIVLKTSAIVISYDAKGHFKYDEVITTKIHCKIIRTISSRHFNKISFCFSDRSTIDKKYYDYQVNLNFNDTWSGKWECLNNGKHDILSNIIVEEKDKIVTLTANWYEDSTIYKLRLSGVEINFTSTKLDKEDNKLYMMRVRE